MTAPHIFVDLAAIAAASGLIFAAWRWAPGADCQSLPGPASAVTKRRFRMRQDGWVRHDGGPRPLPDNMRILVWHRGVTTPMESQSDQIPERWWLQTAGRWDVLWFRSLEDWRQAAPPISWGGVAQ